MEVKINKEKTIIAAMFNSIAANYDKLNHILSLGIDKYWRSVLIKEVLKDKPYTALDIACGTGDITIALMKRGVKATGLDIADKMLERAITKSKKSMKSLRHKSGKQYFLPEYICASAHQLPFDKEAFDLVTIGFGIRNFEHRGESLLEMQRVLKPGGRLAILEFATPRNYLWRNIYNIYFLKILPYIGKIISGDNNAYSYLPSSVGTFPQYKEFSRELEHFGYVNIEMKILTGGVSVLYTAKKMKSD